VTVIGWSQELRRCERNRLVQHMQSVRTEGLDKLIGAVL